MDLITIDKILNDLERSSAKSSWRPARRLRELIFGTQEAGDDKPLLDIIEKTLTEAFQDMRDGEPNGCIVEKGCEAAAYDDPADAAEGFIEDAAADVLKALKTEAK